MGFYVTFYLMFGFGTRGHEFESTSLFWRDVGLDVTFYLMFGFGTQGHEFESTSLFWGNVGLSPQLCFLRVVGLTPLFGGDCGFESFFGGWNFLKFCLVWMVVLLSFFRGF